MKASLVNAVMVWTCLLGMGLLSGQAHAQHKELDGTPIADSVYRGFQSNFRKYAIFVGEVEGGFAVIPGYDRRLDSSRGITVAQAREELKAEFEERNGNLVRTRVRYPDRADIEAYTRALPEMTVGSYGWIASVEVVEIIDRNQMIVKEVWLVDRPTVRAAYEKDKAESERRNDGRANRELLEFNYGKRIEMVEQQDDRDEGFTRKFRLVGYDTRGLRVGDRWKGANDEGMQVAVAFWEVPEPDEEEEGRRRRRRAEEPRLVLTEVGDLMRQTVGEQGFKALLAEREMTVTSFVELVRDLRENDRRNAEERILRSLLPPEMDPDGR